MKSSRIVGAIWVFFGISVISMTVVTVVTGDEEAKASGAEHSSDHPSNHSDDHSKESKPVRTAQVSRPSQTAQPASATASACLVDESAVEDIKKSKERNEVKAKELMAKEIELKVREQTVQDQLKAIENIRAEISKVQAAHNAETEERVQHLTDTILTMSPKAAAKLLSSVEEKLSIEIISRLDTQRLSKIMNVMDANQSTRLSERLVGVQKASNQKLTQTKKGGKPHVESNAKHGEPKPGIQVADKGDRASSANPFEIANAEKKHKPE